VVSTGCATKRDIRDLRADMRAQTARQDSAIASIASLIRALNDSTLSQQSTEMLDFRGDVSRQLLDIMDQLIQVQELAGQNQRALTRLRDEAESRRDRLSAIPRSPVATDAEADGAFQAAMAAFQNGSLTAARMGFQAFIRQYPAHPEVASAQYYLADVHLQEGNVDDAVDGFRNLTELYPTSERVPDALYRLGLIELERGNPDEARRLFERVVSSYPDSDAAIVARERLSEIG
jgi:tol-pal system protein YbgF